MFDRFVWQTADYTVTQTVATVVKGETSVHFVVENPGFSRVCRWDQMLVQYLQDVFADGFQLLLNLHSQNTPTKGETLADILNMENRTEEGLHVGVCHRTIQMVKVSLRVCQTFFTTSGGSLLFE